MACVIVPVCCLIRSLREIDTNIPGGDIGAAFGADVSKLLCSIQVLYSHSNLNEGSNWQCLIIGDRQFLTNVGLVYRRMFSSLYLDESLMTNASNFNIKVIDLFMRKLEVYKDI